MRNFVATLISCFCFVTGVSAQSAPDLAGLQAGKTMSYFTSNGYTQVTYIGPKDDEFEFHQTIQMPFRDISFYFYTDQSGRLLRVEYPRFFMSFEPIHCGYIVGECSFVRGLGALSRPEIHRKTRYIDGMYFFEETLLSGGPATIEKFGCAIIDEFGQELAYFSENGGGGVLWYLRDTGQVFAEGETAFGQVKDLCNGAAQLS